MTRKHSVLLADGHPVALAGLRAVLARDPAFKVVGDSGTSEMAIRLAFRLKPDIIVIDFHLEDTCGFEPIRRIQDGHREGRILVFTASICDRDIGAALEARVEGYVSKDAPAATILAAIRSVARGDVYYCSKVNARVVDLQARPKGSGRCVSRAATLTPRELEILRYLAEGLAVKEVANQLTLSTKTVDNHKRSIMNKLGIHDRVVLSRFAAREGLVDP